jgi:putative nucleotidyltransferase with HDIG domain
MRFHHPLKHADVTMIPFTREQALSLLFQHTNSDSLRKHGLAVEAAMRAYARRFNEDEDEWGMVGLLHDFDYEAHPDLTGHPYEGNRILTELGYPEHIRKAIMSHASYTGVPRESRMEHTLFAVDELCGFLMAVAYVRPDRKMASVEPRSVRKKMKDKAFARAVSRDDILLGAAGLGVELDEHIAFTIAALAANADALGV